MQTELWDNTNMKMSDLDFFFHFTFSLYHIHLITVIFLSYNFGILLVIWTIPISFPSHFFMDKLIICSERTPTWKFHILNSLICHFLSLLVLSFPIHPIISLFVCFSWNIIGYFDYSDLLWSTFFHELTNYLSVFFINYIS